MKNIPLFLKRPNYNYIFLAETTLLRKSSLTQEYVIMNNLVEKYKQHQNDLSVNGSLHNQIHQGDSIIDENHDQVYNCEPEQLDIKPYPFLHQNPNLPDLNFESELPASTLNSLSQPVEQYQDVKPVVYTQHQEYQSDISMASAESCDGLYFLPYLFCQC